MGRMIAGAAKPLGATVVISLQPFYKEKHVCTDYDPGIRCRRDEAGT
jgi:hypothetical protein